jgi:hypothetical protein
LFGLYSKRFRRLPHLGLATSINFEGPVSPSSLSSFISGCQSLPYEITQDNAFDLDFLSKAWEVDAIQQEVRSFIDKLSSVDRLVYNLKFELERNADTSSFEFELACRLNDALASAAFATLPTGVISRIFKQAHVSSADHRLLKSVLLTLYDSRGASVAFLFEYLDYTQLSPDEISDLSRNQVIFPHLRESLDISLKSFSERLEAMDRKFALVSRLGGIRSRTDHFGEALNAQALDVRGALDIVSDVRRLMEDVQNRGRAAVGRTDSGAVDVRQDSPRLAAETPTRQNTLSLYRQRPKPAAAPDAAAGSLRGSVIQQPVPSLINLSVEFKGDPNQAGILAGLRKEKGQFGKPPKVLSSSTDKTGRTGGPEVVLLEDNPMLMPPAQRSLYWASENRANQWIQFDFSPRSLRLDAYRLRTYGITENGDHMKSWVLQGCPGIGEAWVEIDALSDVQVLNGPNRSHTFVKPCAQPFKTLRIQQKGINCQGRNVMVLARVEFFGTLQK